MPQKPLLNRAELEKLFSSNPSALPANIGNVPYTGLTLPDPSSQNNPQISTLTNLENELLSIRPTSGSRRGGSILRDLSDVTSNRYNVYVPGDYNNEDAYAQGQGWPARMMNGIGKGLALTGTTFLQSTIGLVNGIARTSSDGRAASFYDNDFNRSLDEFNKELEDALPNYYTDVERNARWYSPNKLFTANFFWDGIVKNLGFAAGTILSGAVYTKALSSIPLASRLFSTGKAAQALAATEEGLLSANKVAETYGKIKGLSDKFIGGYNILNPGGRAVVAGLATTGEAGFEAYHNLNGFRDQKIQEFRDVNNGRDPLGIDLERINSEADNVGNSSYLLNVGLLTATNYIQFPKILGSSYTAEKGIINSQIKEVVKDVTDKYLVKEPITRIGRLLSGINKIRPYTFSASEAFEEGAQFAISIGTQDYYNKRYDGDAADFVESLSQGITQTLSTDEGMQNVLIGGLSGALMLGRGRFLERAARERNTVSALEAFNRYKISDFTKETVDAVNRGTILQQEREDSLRRGNILESKDLEADYTINYLTPRIKYGRLDLVKSDINDYRQLASTEEGFAQLQGEGKALSTDTRIAYLRRLDNLERTVENMNSLYQSLQLRYGNLVDKDNKPVYSPEVMNKMIYSATKVVDYDQRIPELTANLFPSGIIVNDIITDILAGNSEKFNEATAVIQAMDVNPDIKENLYQSLVDVSELSLRRQKFLVEYTDIKNSPNKYKDAPAVVAGETITVKTKVGDKEIETGTEYFLGRVVEYDKVGKEVYRAPKLTLIQENEDGTIKVKDSQGNVKDIDKSVLEDYKLAKVTDTLSNKKAKFFMEHWNTIYEFNFGKGRKQVGRLEYSPEEGVLTFAYKDKSGKVRRIEVTGDQFVPKKGFISPQISAIGELTSIQKKSLEDFAKEQDIRTAVKKESRLRILSNLFDEVSKKHTDTVKLITQKKTELTNIQEDLKDLQEQIKDAEFDGRAKKSLRFKVNVKRVLEASIRLSRMQEQLQNEIQVLETEKDELEFNASYITDLEQNIDELPTDSKEFLEELKSQRSVLEDLILENGSQINNISSLLDKVGKSLESAISYVKDVISQFEKKYPKAPVALGQEWVEFLQANPNFLKVKHEYKQDLAQVEEIVAQVEDFDIKPSEDKIKELRDELTSLQSALENVEKEIKAKDLILSRFEEIAEKYTKQKEEEKKLSDNAKLKQEILGTADTGVQTATFDKDYEPQSKKSDVGVVTSTKPATSSQLPHHLRANQFGTNLDKLPNRTSIKGVVVTSKNEDSYGLTGLMNFLKGDSTIDSSKIVSLLILNENGKPVGVDGKLLETPTFDNIIIQVFPDPKLEWSKDFGGGTMFRKETTPEQIEYYKKQYTDWVNEQLETPSNTLHNIEASFGIPQYVSTLDDKGNKKRDYTAIVSVEEANLIKDSDLKEQPLIFIPTTETTVEKGSTSITTPLGRVFLNLPNGYAKLNNRKITPKEAFTIYEAIHQLSIDIFESGFVSSDKSLRLLNWLRSIIYWGSPKNKAGHNSIFFDTIDGEFSLFLSGKGKSYPFTPSSMENNKADIITTIEGMYNNINSGLTNKVKLWNEPYEEIVNISEKGTIQSKEWTNYQTYLLSREGRTNEELPLYTQLLPILKEGDVNRLGIYFTIKDDVQRYTNVPKAQKITPTPLPKQREQPKFVLDGKSVNIYTSPAGTKIRFAATNTKDIKILTGEDAEKTIADLTPKVGKEKAIQMIKNSISLVIAPQMSELGETIIEDDDDTTLPKKDIFAKKKVEETSAIKEAKIEVSFEDEEEMEFDIDSMEDVDEMPLRVKIENDIKSFEKENWPKAEQWLKSNFPNLPVYRVKNIIQATNGLQAWGMLKDASLYVYENAEVGTIYHEVFEGVWKIFTTLEEQIKLLNEFRKKKGTFNDRPTGQVIKYSDATNQQVKEQLAEEFRDYVLNPKVTKSFLSKIFSDIVEFIRNFFSGNKAISNTEELFKRINTGYYKQYTPTSQLSFAKKGIIDIEEAFANSESEFRIEGFNADVVNDIMQHMTYLTLTDLIKNNKSLFNVPKIPKKELYKRLETELRKTALKSRKEAEKLIEEGKVTQEQAQPTINKSIVLWKNIKEQWSKLQEKHEEYLRIYSIEFDENDEVILKDEDASKKGDYQDSTKIDNFKKANSAIKLLLSTIPIVNSEGKLVYSSINGAKLLPTSQVYMTLMNRLHNSRNIDEMIERIKDIAEEDSNYRTLYNRLTKNTSDLSEVSESHHSQLLTSFWRTFKKWNPDVKNVYIFENGDVEVGDSNLSSAARQISSEYTNAIIKTVKGTNPYFEYSAKEKVYIGKPVSVKSVRLTNNQERINFLKSLGIEFTNTELNKLSNDKRETFNETVAGIKRSIEKAEKIATVSRKVLDIKGRLMQLSLIRAAIENPEFDSTFFNVKGERTQTFLGTNPVSDFHDYLSQINNLNELVNTPYEYLLTDVFSKNSVILAKMFNLDTGNRIKGGEDLMNPGYADGTVNLDNGKRKQSAKQTYKERTVQEINLNLSGYYYSLVPGDSSMEHMEYMGNHITPDNLLSGWSKVHNIFKGYFISELLLSRENRSIQEIKNRKSSDLRFFKSILGDKLHSEILKDKNEPEQVYTRFSTRINNAVEGFIKNEASKTEVLLKKYEILVETPLGNSIENIAFQNTDNVSNDVLARQLNSLAANFAINNIELHKLVYSDPYQYIDELKRIKNALSPRQAIINRSPEFNKSLNSIWNEGFDSEDIGRTDFTRDYFKTVTLSDVPATIDLKDYGIFDETDGGGIISFKAYRWFRIKAGEWNDNEEGQYRYDIAYEKRARSIELSKDEKRILEQSNPSVKSAYTPLKPVVFGNKANNQIFNSITLDKFALYPLSYRVAFEINPSSNGIKHYRKMQNEDIDYSIFKSGRKVGDEGTNTLYNDDGSFNTNKYENIINIPHNIIAVQSEVPSKDEPSSSRGTQITKLATLDFMDAGVPVDYENDKKFDDRYKSWISLTEDQKQKKSSLYKEIKNNQKLLETITEEGYKTLLKRMGIKETVEGGFQIVDFTKVTDTLREEILKREVNDNISEALNGFLNGSVVLEATPAYQQIRNILYSIADKNIISPKISGGQKVQIPSTLLESVRAKKEKGAYTSNVLKFYEDKDNERVAEIMVGRWFDSPLSDKDLLEFLNNTDEGKKILSGIAYRIPTQKQNSIDSFRIKQFLPREFGDSVVIPSALVKKVGSDFDIDKLFIYFKNIYTSIKGDIKIIPFVGFGTEAKEKLTKMYEEGAFFTKEQRKIISKWINNRKAEDTGDVVNALSIAIFGEEAYEQEVIDDFLTITNEKELQDRIIDQVYKKSLENEYIQSLENLVSHPLNFENLIKPNSADQLKQLAKDITKAIGREEFDYTSTINMLDREFMSSLRQAFVSGKYAIGIAAVNQTNHSLNQRQPIYIDIDRWDKLSEEDKYWLSGGTMDRNDVSIKFKNFNKIEVDNKIVPTLSMIKNAKGENISDIIGQFIDGYVDISKGPWIMELGASPNVASTWLFLVKMGVPIEDVAYFMNQPIIRDYIASIENAGYVWLFIDDFVESVKDSNKYKVNNNETSKIKEIPSNLKSTVGKDNFSSKEKAEQQFILNEFLKYSKMANQMFLVTQGSNWDTATFNDPYLVFKKTEQFKKAQSTIISSVDELVNNSFIQKLVESIYNVRDAFSTILTSDLPNTREVMEKVLLPYIDLSDREFVKVARKAVNDLFDWAVQNDRKLNTQIQDILLSDNSTAREVSDFVVSVRKNSNHPLYNNQVIKLITPHFSDKREGGVNNLKIKNKDNKVYDQNQMIYAFAELREYLKGQNNPLYGSLVRLAVLQSGLSNSPISFTSLLPYEDFKEIYNKTLVSLENSPNLQDYYSMNVFERNNWNDNDLVPYRRARWKQNKSGEWKYNNNMKFYGYNRVVNAIIKDEIPQLVKINTLSREANNDIIVYSWEIGSKAQKEAKRKIGDYSYIKKGLFKKIYRGNEPFTVSFTMGEKVISDYVYKVINAWGDSHVTDGIYFGANEFYSTPRPSIIDNAFIKVDNELADESIIPYFEKPVEENKGSDELPNCV